MEYLYPAATICLMLGFNGVDINMGCPAKKVSDRGAGAGLIQYPDNAKNIILEVKRAKEDFREFWKGKKYSSELVNEYFIKYLSGLKDIKLTALKLGQTRFRADSESLVGRNPVLALRHLASDGAGGRCQFRGNG